MERHDVLVDEVPVLAVLISNKCITLSTICRFPISFLFTIRALAHRQLTIRCFRSYLTLRTINSTAFLP